MYEFFRKDLDYTLDDFNKLKSAIARQNNMNVQQLLPLFPDSDDYQKRKELYGILSSFPKIQKSCHDQLFEYAKSLNTEEGLKSKYHYANDPNGVKKQEIWKLLVDLKQKYYDAIRYTEYLISYTGTQDEQDKLLAQTQNAINVFLQAFSNMNVKGASGEYIKSPDLKNSESATFTVSKQDLDKIYKPRRPKLTQKEAAACCGVSLRTLKNWDSGATKAPDWYPGRDVTAVELKKRAKYGKDQKRMARAARKEIKNARQYREDEDTLDTYNPNLPDELQ